MEKDLSSNEIAKTYNISKHSIQTVRMRASALGVSYEKAKEQSEEELYELFFPDRAYTQNIYHLPDYEYVHKELRKVGVTLKLLHDEYAEDCRKSGKIAVGYSKFCKDYGKNSRGQGTLQTTSSTSLATGSRWTGLARR